MRPRLWFAALALALLSGARTPPPSDSDVLLARTADFLTAVRGKKVPKVRSYFRLDGFTCTDDMIPWKLAAKDLENHASYLYTFLFSASDFHARFDPSYKHVALADVLESPALGTVRVEFEAPDAACTWLRASESAQLEICWVELHGAWMIDRGLYDCE